MILDPAYIEIIIFKKIIDLKDYMRRKSIHYLFIPLIIMLTIEPELLTNYDHVFQSPSRHVFYGVLSWIHTYIHTSQI